MEVVKLLLRAGADVKIRNNKNLTVFDLATLAGLPQITRLFAPGGKFNFLYTLRFTSFCFVNHFKNSLQKNV